MVEDEATLTAAIIALALQYGRYGYRRITALLRRDGWTVNVKRVERIWRREGLKVPARQPKRARLWLNDGSCLRLRPKHPDHVWSYDFVEHRTHNGRKYRMLNVIDEFTRECLAIRVARKLKALDVIDVLSDLFSLRGVPGHIRSDNGPEFIAKAVQDWIAAVGSVTAYIEPGSPWENGYCESFNAKLRDELLNGPDPVKATKQSSVVVTNPTHIAVGIRYSADEAPLPRICVAGTEGVAKIIRETALAEGIPIMENVPLARGLYAEGRIGEFIPDDLLEPVAEVLKWAKQIEDARKEEAELDGITLDELPTP